MGKKLELSVEAQTADFCRGGHGVDLACGWTPLGPFLQSPVAHSTRRWGLGCLIHQAALWQDREGHVSMIGFIFRSCQSDCYLLSPLFSDLFADFPQHKKRWVKCPRLLSISTFIEKTEEQKDWLPVLHVFFSLTHSSLTSSLVKRRNWGVDKRGFAVAVRSAGAQRDGGQGDPAQVVWCSVLREKGAHVGSISRDPKAQPQSWSPSALPSSFFSSSLSWSFRSLNSQQQTGPPHLHASHKPSLPLSFPIIRESSPLCPQPQVEPIPYPQGARLPSTPPETDPMCACVRMCSCLPPRLHTSTSLKYSQCPVLFPEEMISIFPPKYQFFRLTNYRKLNLYLTCSAVPFLYTYLAWMTI